MNYTISEEYNCVVFTFKGKVMGGPDAQKFHDEIKTLIDKGKTNIIGDLSRVSFMNSSGIGILIAALTSVRNGGGNFVLCGASDRIESILVVTKLITVFDHFKTKKEAVDSFQKAGTDK